MCAVGTCDLFVKLFMQFSMFKFIVGSLFQTERFKKNKYFSNFVNMLFTANK